jgi:hypothetical protein
MSESRDLRWLLDCEDIKRLAYLYGRGIDARQVEDYSLFDQCLLPDVEIVYEFGTWKGLEEHKKITAANMLRVFTFTHHLITNPLISIKGDRATASYRCTAAHGIKTPQGEKIVYGGSTYTQDCVRTADGWRVSRHSCGKSWIDDQGELLAMMVGKAS